MSKIAIAREIKEMTVLPHVVYGSYALAGDSRQLTSIAQGDDYNQRNGRQIHPTSLAIDFFLRGPQSNAGAVGTFTLPTNPVPWRIIVFQDMGYIGTLRPISQILEATTTTADNYDNYISGYNDDYVCIGKHTKANPVRILYDKRGWFEPVNSGYSSKVGQWVKCRVSGSRLKTIQYGGTAATDAKSGAIFYYIMLGPSSNIHNNGSYLVRHTLRYYDD